MLSGSRHPRSVFFPIFLKVLCHLEEFNTRSPVPPQRAPGSTGAGWQSLQGGCRKTWAASPVLGPKAFLAAPGSGGPAPTQRQGAAPSVLTWVTLIAFKMCCLNGSNMPIMVFFTASVYIQVWFTEIKTHLDHKNRLLLRYLLLDETRVSSLFCFVTLNITKGTIIISSYQWLRAERGFMACGVGNCRAH